MKRVLVGKIKTHGGYESLAESSDRDREELAYVLATHSPPGLKGTDRAFMQRSDQDDGLVGDFATMYRENYKKATGSLPHGKRYMSTLARFPGDPRAFVSSQGEVLEICRKENWNWHGTNEHKAHDVPPPPEKPYEVAPDLVDKKIARLTRENPDIAPTPKEKVELRHKVKEEMSSVLR